MNTFLDDLFKGYKELKALDEWSKGFWKINPQDIKIRFAQQGYEDKGCGHTQRIIANVGELLGKYFERLYDLNYTRGASKKTFKEDMKNEFKSNLVLFYTAAHLHDFGTGFPGIFKALVEYVKEKAQNPPHIGEIIYQYHHYTSFIILMEISIIKNFKDETLKNQPYLKNIIEGNDSKKVIEDLQKLNKILLGIYDKFFRDEDFSQFNSSEMSFEDFKVILAILCLLHKQVEYENVQSILRKLKEADNSSIGLFNKWWDNFERSKKWTEKVHRAMLFKNSELPYYYDESLKSKSGRFLDLLLVEALLQYGDKTEITIARLARKPMGCEKIDTPLQQFTDDTAYDNRKGYICTDMAQRVISDFARSRACQFIPVLLVQVEDDKKKKGNSPDKEKRKEKKPKLNIVIHYLRFKGDEDMFKLIRYQNEKDFYDLAFLRIIRYHIPGIINNIDQQLKNPVFTLTFKKEEHQIEDTLNLNLNLNGFPDTESGLTLLKETINENKTSGISTNVIFPFTRKNRQAMENYVKLPVKRRRASDSKGPQQAFYETCDMDVPASFELLAVLNLFQKED